mgnify:CR=1 FL=1
MIGTSTRSDIKHPKTFEEQVEILRARNLRIDDEERAREVLSRINYYRLSAYALSHQTGDLFHDGVSFKDIYNLYEFDKKFRSILMERLESIEIAMRTQVAYTIAHKYGALGYREADNFHNSSFHAQNLQEWDKQLERSDEVFVKHHEVKYGAFPVWVAIEVTTFGLLSRIYSNLKKDARAAIARMYYGVSDKYLASWLHALSTLRNICAHFGRTYNRPLVIKPKMYGSDIKKGIKNDSIFAALILMGRLTRSWGGWSSFVSNIEALVGQYDFVNLDLMGFPEDWYALLSNP